MSSLSLSYTSFTGHTRIAAGSLAVNALALKQAVATAPAAPALTFCDNTGALVDIDLSGSEQDMLARLPQPQESPAPDIAAGEPGSRGRGRPRLGVIAREVTLLPRHWDWLATQPGGASVTLRKLVDEARKANLQKNGQRQATENAYRFMAAMAGDLPGFEEVSRALFAHDGDRFHQLTEAWPVDVRDYVRRLAEPAAQAGTDHCR